MAKPTIRFKGYTEDWEQRKLGELVIDHNAGIYISKEDYGEGTNVIGVGNIYDRDIFDGEIYRLGPVNDDKFILEENDILYGESSLVPEGIARTVCVGKNGAGSAFAWHTRRVKLDKNIVNSHVATLELNYLHDIRKYLVSVSTQTALTGMTTEGYFGATLTLPSVEEQQKISDYFKNLDNLITLHHHKLFIINGLKLFTVMQCKCYLLLNISNKNKKTKKEIKLMPELERVIEEKLIDQLVYGDSQWTYREDLKTEEDLWRNFKYILEQNNKDRLNGESLSDAEFEQVKNQLQFSSFYKAGEWLVGENGKVMVHVQRDTEKLHLVVMNHEHIAGGSSVYEVINQYSALKDEDDYYTVSRNRRFDVTLMINGLPMIHIELKNRQHSYMDGFNQIKKYISEGKFTGIFSAVQIFVVSNGVDTKYFAAASDTDLNAKFMSGWVDEKNNPVSDYLDFAKSILRIPEAHEMIARYTVLDRDAKRLIILRPYQIHAIESIREASKTGKSGFVWHTTGSGKTLTSYKATRNLLMDIPSLDKTIFLIDRKDLDTQTSSAFQAYANNDVIAVDKTDNVNDLKKKLKSGDRKVIVTTIQKMQILVTKRLQEDTPEYNKIKNLRIAFVVDECHRAVTPKTKRELERFFGRSLWFGFTGTPRFAENPYAQMGDLPRTTEELYGKCLHKYTIQNAIKDNAVLGFQVEHNGPKNMEDETDPSLYDNETHMLRVLDIILNKSYQKFGLQNGKGQTYEAILTTSSIQLAQKYYELLSKVKNGEADLEIDERMRQVLPDYPKFAITYSVTENEEGSHVNQEKMQKHRMTENVIIKDINCKGINVVDLVKHILNKKCNNIYTQKMENKHIIVSADFFDDMRNRQVNMSLLLDYDESTIYEVKLEIHQDENDLIDYSMDLKLYYYENLDIYKAIQEIRAENDTPKTVRIYKLMYNSYPIKGTYSFNLKNCKLIFHTLNIKERTEPLTEQIVAFDVKLKSNNMQEARAKAYNIVSDFVSYLSLLLDVCFYDPQSIYRNFVRLSYDSHYQRIIAQERYRTAFIDNELELVVKDNLNGLATYKDVIKGENFDNGVISIANPDKSDVKFIEKYGNTKHIEEVFEKHRLEKVPKNQTVYCDEIKEEIFVLGQEIFIPKCIRDYFRGIEELDDKIRKSFRNCSRLYNKSTIIGMNESSLQIALLVASVESLAKTEGISFSQFVQKYCETAKKCDIDDMYEIRSKLFHSGEFSFLEFEISMNPYLNPVYEYLSDKYDEYRKIVRKALISWIKHNILTK